MARRDQGPDGLEGAARGVNCGNVGTGTVCPPIYHLPALPLSSVSEASRLQRGFQGSGPQNTPLASDAVPLGLQERSAGAGGDSHPPSDGRGPAIFCQPTQSHLAVAPLSCLTTAGDAALLCPHLDLGGAVQRDQQAAALPLQGCVAGGVLRVRAQFGGSKGTVCCLARASLAAVGLAVL